MYWRNQEILVLQIHLLFYFPCSASGLPSSFVTSSQLCYLFVLLHSPADEGAPLTQFQEELVQLASQLNGDHRLLNYQHLGKSMTVGQAHAYVTSAVSQFLEAGRMAARAGQDLESLVEVKPSLVGRRAGTFNSKYYDSS
jgi:hypothetical protein